MTDTFEVSPDASFRLAMLSTPPNVNIELFQWDAPEQMISLPRASDIGGHHLCVYVDDIDDACNYLRSCPGVRLLGEVKTVGPGSPVSGTRWTYFVTPWGLQMELVDRVNVADPPSFVVPRSVSDGTQ